MNNIMKTRKNLRKLFLAVSCLVLVALVTSGCEPLRKKFDRSKRKDKKEDEFVPVLTPEEYPVPVFSAASHYKHHYSLWRIWEKDLLQGFSEGDSDKRQRYNLNQALVQLEEMHRVITGEKQEQLSEVISDLKEVIDDYKSPPAIRNMVIIKSAVNNIGRTVRNNFRFEQIEASLISD